jgi:glycosyltransferase involved in cell wall biosynthesis
MRKIAFFGPGELSGIGQVTRTLCKLVHGDYYEFGDALKKKYDVGFCFLIPIPVLINIIKENYVNKCTKIVYMTVCETETVHECYAELEKLTSDTIWTPSDFSTLILQRQFPKCTFRTLRHYAGPCTVQYKKIPNLKHLENVFVFYHIGNIIDPRKNVKSIIEAFLNLQLPDAVLLLKASCNRSVHWNIPGIIIVEGVLDQPYLEYIHKLGDCYVSFSNSEGAGMGAIEAAMRHKPVILPEYGAGREYIDSEYLIPCGTKKIGFDDFLFQKDMVWGDPDPKVLKEFMMDAYTKGRGRTVVHTKTHDIMGKVPCEIINILLE